MEVGPSSPQASPPPPSKPSAPVPYPLFAPKHPSGSPTASYQVLGSSVPPAGPPAKKPRAKKASAGAGAGKDARQAKLAFAGLGGGLAAVRVPLGAEERIGGGGLESSAGKAQGKSKGKVKVSNDDSELAEVRTMDKTSKTRATKGSKMGAVKESEAEESTAPQQIIGNNAASSSSRNPSPLAATTVQLVGSDDSDDGAQTRRPVAASNRVRNKRVPSDGWAPTAIHISDDDDGVDTPIAHPALPKAFSSKTAHPFFRGVREIMHRASSPVSIDLEAEEEGVDLARSSRSPILDLSSTTFTRPQQPPKAFLASANKPAHSFFAPKTKPRALDDSQAEVEGGAPPASQQPAIEAPWPDRKNAHVGFSFTPLAAPNGGSLSFPWRVRSAAKGKARGPMVSPEETIGTALAGPSNPHFQDRRLFGSFVEQLPLDQTIPPFILQHPALQRFLPSPAFYSSAFASSRELLVDRTRPLAASQVLGNEDEAIYLRDWLSALELKHRSAEAFGEAGPARKRKEVVRKVVKTKKKARREDDWIVESDEEEDKEMEEIGEFHEFHELAGLHGSAPQSSGLLSGKASSSKVETYPSLTSRLTNSILLVGPPGSGKTAAVYACASELGWDIFEVYPGVGKRSGHALANMVGEVGKSHLVAKGGTGGGRGGSNSAASVAKGNEKAKPYNNAFALLMTGGAGSKSAATTDATSIDVDEIDTIQFRSTAPPGEQSREVVSNSSLVSGVLGGNKVKQSLILLEEVDILFEEDKGFWQSVISVIGESRRPVVMTCNDPSTLPLAELPLQTTLRFLPPPSYLVVPYLEVIARALDISPDPGAIAELYSSQIHRSLAPSLGDQPGHPAPSQVPDGPDLRRSLHALQLGGVVTSSVSAARRATSLEAHLAHGGALTDELLDWTRPAGPSVFPVPPPTIPPHEPILTLRAITALVDTLSFVDAYIDTRPTTASELLEIDRFEPSADDETGYGLLPKPTVDPLAPGLAETSREGEIALEAGLLARWVFDSSTRGKLPSFASSPARPTTVELSAARVSHLDTLLTFLAPQIDPPAPLLPSPALILDYAPAMRTLLAADDLERLLKEAEPGSRMGALGRRSGRMMRASAQAANLSIVATKATMAEWAGEARDGAGGAGVSLQGYLWRLGEREMEAGRKSGLVW